MTDAATTSASAASSAAAIASAGTSSERRDDAGGGAFEGEIEATATANVDTDRQDEAIHLVCRGAKVRWTIASGNAWRLYDGDAHLFYTVFPSEQLVVKTPEGALARGAAADASAAAPWSMTITDPSGKIAGHACERVKIAQGARVFDACVAPSLPDVPFDLASPVLAAAVPYDAMLREKRLFPLSGIERGDMDAGRRPAARFGSSRFTVLRISPRTVGDEEVRIPTFRTIESASLTVGHRMQR